MTADHPSAGAGVPQDAARGTAEAEEPARLDAGTYELLRNRLEEQAKVLAEKVGELNARRLEAFGGSELTLIGTERIRTANNCVPRDIVHVGKGGPGADGAGLMLFGYNVFIGLKPETRVEDVFALHSYENGGSLGDGDAELPDLLKDPRFERDFAEMYRYYRETRLMQLRRIDGKLLAVFQTGPSDIRVLRWALGASGGIEYLDNKGERDHVFPPSHDFEWIETTREHHILGRHPHISIENEVFVETVGGHLTIKLENNTESGEGIYDEPVDEPLQSLADAAVYYARIGPLILLRILPYNETIWRYLVYNTQTREVVRLDGIGQACQRLPEDHGIIFPGGYYLATGAAKTFDTDTTDLEFKGVIRSPNGEDVLYVFYAQAEGRSLLLPYNVIRKEVATPIPCHGYSIFDDGTMVIFRATSEEPTRVHPMQIWRTPYVSDTYAAARDGRAVGEQTELERIGNADLVRGISDCLSVARRVGEMTPNSRVYEGLIKDCTRVFDHFHWLEQQGLHGPLADLRATAEQVLDEFETVEELTGQAAAALTAAETDIAAMVRRARGEAPPGGGTSERGVGKHAATGWVEQLAEIRRAQGHLVTLGEMRYADKGRIGELSEHLTGELATAGRRAVAFLQEEKAFDPYHADVERIATEAGEIKTVAQAVPLTEKLTEQAEGLEIVTEVVGTLEIADATVRTGILERIGEVTAAVNRARALLDGRRRDLQSREGRAAFSAEFGLLTQAVAGAIAAADTPEKCDEQLGRLMLQLENLESRFGSGDGEFLAQIADKRDDIYEAFSARKQALLDERQRRADRLADSAERILASVQRRVAGLSSADEVNTYFAADPMVAKLRSLIDDLRGLGDQVRAEELEGRIKSARQEAGRSLRDRLDLFSDGGETVRLGRHRFAVNSQPMDLTLVPHDGAMSYSITGTDYRQPVQDPGFQETREFWDQLLVSESPSVYRAEHLAASVLAAGDPGTHDADDLLPLVREFAETRYDEGYERGVHDHDAVLILEAVQRLRAGAGLLRYPPDVRAAAQLYWSHLQSPPSHPHHPNPHPSHPNPPNRPAPPPQSPRDQGVVPQISRDQGVMPASPDVLQRRVRSLARARESFGHSPAIDQLYAEFAENIADFLERTGLPEVDADLAGEYLFEELADPEPGFVMSAGARSLLDAFRRLIDGPRLKEFTDDLDALGDDLAARHQLARAWLAGSAPADPPELAEALAVQLLPDLQRHDSSATLTTTVEGLLGAHPRIAERRLELRLDEFLARTRNFREKRAPAYRAYQKRRNELAARERDRLRLDEYKPKVMSAFVRNRLLDEVYLPLIGDNLAKQLGAAGDAKRTDQSGMLLLISPPGYGKTTLMEYIASRLGLIFVKVNGPALGHSITSLDPAEAPNATARQEIEKISFALEMGNNVLLYLDDIQHTSPELLQKFISLCDAQRRMEGVWGGRTRTYDLRGKRFAVCMAGNPYTEQGQKFRIPDMLANRADVWNLGDVLTGRDELFALSYIENALTSNPVLAPLSTGPREDIDLLVRLARGDEGISSDQLVQSYSAVELDQILSVLRKLIKVQALVLSVNQAYIASAAQAAESRVEPPFLLQGSYRNMNKLTERIVPVMNDDELEALIDDHYLGEAQTLTSGAEANLLKLGSLRGRLSEEEAERWGDVTDAFVRAQALGGSDDDPMARAVGAMGLLADRVGGVEEAIKRAAASP